MKKWEYSRFESEPSFEGLKILGFKKAKSSKQVSITRINKFTNAVVQFVPKEGFV